MILHLIERYYTIYWVIFIGFCVLKLLFSFPIEGNPHGIIGIFLFLVKWYSPIDLSMVDSPALKARMRFQNVVTVCMYIALLVVATVFLMKTLL